MSFLDVQLMFNSMFTIPLGFILVSLGKYLAFEAVNTSLAAYYG